MSRLWRVVMVAGAVLGAFVLYEVVTSFVAYTADAYVRSDLVAVAPEVTGRIVAVHVRDNQTVRRDDPLITIDPVPFQIVVAQRQAEINEAQAHVAADRVGRGPAASGGIRADLRECDTRSCQRPGGQFGRLAPGLRPGQR